MFDAELGFEFRKKAKSEKSGSSVFVYSLWRRDFSTDSLQQHNTDSSGMRVLNLT
jgi:hypothetical protein